MMLPVVLILIVEIYDKVFLKNIQLNKIQYSKECNKNDIINPLHMSVSNVFF